MSNIKEIHAASALWHRVVANGVPPQRRLSDAGSTITLAGAVAGYRIEAPPETFRARSVLISCERQFSVVLALL